MLTYDYGEEQMLTYDCGEEQKKCNSKSSPLFRV